MNLLITIDTEEDDSWSHRLPFRTENITFLPRFQALCDRYGFPVTWLCTAPILEDPRIAEAMGEAVEAGRAEIGIHLHPWSCPPYPGGGGPDPSVPIYPHELTPEEFRAKISYLAGLARGRFGRSAITYRAGRWGFHGAQVEALLDAGIRIDCSVTPQLSWRRHLGKPDGDGGPDFRGAPQTPYWVDPADVRRPGTSRLLELPVTVLHAGGPFSHIPGAWSQLQNLEDEVPGRVMRRLGWAPLMLRPWPGRSVETLLKIVEAAQRCRLPYVMLMLHSSELMPGGSPYFPKPENVDQLFAVLDGLFLELQTAEVEGMTAGRFGEGYYSNQK
jgi:hypothetical protein